MKVWNTPKDLLWELGDNEERRFPRSIWMLRKVKVQQRSYQNVETSKSPPFRSVTIKMNPITRNGTCVCVCVCVCVCMRARARACVRVRGCWFILRNVGPFGTERAANS